LSVEREKERLDLALNEETQIKKLLASYFISFEGDQFDDFLKFTWNLDLAKKAMKDMQLDTNKLPLGCLKIERIKKSLQILNKIQKQLQIGGTLTSTVEAKISELTAEYYQTLPYDFGIVKPPKIDHILRIKDRVRQMDLLNDIYNMEQCLIKATVIYNFATNNFFRLV
jgi:hypothetical protein